jgi:hypothetical protein
LLFPSAKAAELETAGRMPRDGEGTAYMLSNASKVAWWVAGGRVPGGGGTL